ncbi:MAG: hypothetical protein IKS37_03780 [Solobacterium sp.]|nr:hypothetical protein [Solobacterium sp.]
MNELWKNKAAQCHERCMQEPENAQAWKEYALCMLAYMEDTGIPVLAGNPLFSGEDILKHALSFETDDAEEKLSTLRNRACKKTAARAVKGEAHLYEAILPMCKNGHLSYKQFKDALFEAAGAYGRIRKAGESTAQQLQERGIQYDRTEGCFSFVEANAEHGILVPVFALSDLLLAGESADSDDVYAFALHTPAYDSEEFYNQAADEVAEQWNDLKYCPYCFGRDLRMTMSGKRRCKACKAVIKPFEIYRPQ